MARQRDISFARGAPSLDIIAVDQLKAAADRAFASDPSGAFSYGTAAGYGPLLEWIAARHGVVEEQVIATNGSMQADAFLFDHLVGPGDTVVIEAPTYDRTLLSLQKLGADLLAVPVQADGLDVGALERALGSGARPKLAHVIPNFHNPAGATLSLDKRRRLLELAGEYGFLVFEDDPYVELRFEGDPLPTMLSLDESDTVVYASSFSKTVCPGIRVGYLAGPEGLIKHIRKTATETYISPGMVAQAIVAEFCRSGAIEQSIATVTEALRERRDRTADALERELGDDARFVKPEGGYFMWVDLPEGTDGDALDRTARERGVIFVKGVDFLLEGGESSLRLAYSGVKPDGIDEGVSRLAEAYRELAGTRA
ncbi:MAG: PLP-dependent aminotransferase family protein [Actinomycetota bacterium]|nr:PLP-dependent aminotransferase family protein [Actinomycetota bacterium]